MKLSPPPLRAILLALAFAIASTAGSAEIKKGQSVWSKHNETPLLEQPKPLAKASAKVGFAEKLSVLEVKGAWLQVKADKAQGWVFQGNIAEKKPSRAPAAGLTTVAASGTDTVAAARPLAPAAEEFAQRNNAGDARKDIDWLDAESAKLTPAAMADYMRRNKKGEYQE